MLSQQSLPQAFILSLGLIGCGLAIGQGFKSGRVADRFIEVKGLSERPVKADQGTWNILFNSTGRTLDEAITKNGMDRDQIIRFLKKGGFENDEIRPGTPRVSEDHGSRDGESRYSIADSITLISGKVEKIQEAALRSSELLSSKIALSGWEEPNYYYQKLSHIKPQMIEEATKDARKAAEKFAQDAGANVGSIKRAAQGYFSFRGESEGLKESSQINKIARVVITEEFLLEN